MSPFTSQLRRVDERKGAFSRSHVCLFNRYDPHAAQTKLIEFYYLKYFAILTICFAESLTFHQLSSANEIVVKDIMTMIY